MPVDFSSLLAETLSARGYEVEDASPLDGDSGASYPVSLVARRDQETYLVDALASRTVRDEDVQAVASIVNDTDVDGAILLALAGADNSSSSPGIELVDVWDRREVEAAVGTYVLERHLTEGVDPDEIGPSPVEPYEVPEEAPSTASRTEPTDEEPEPVSPPAASGLDETTPEAEADPQPTTATPDPESDPKPDPQPATAEPSSGTEPEDDVNHRDFVDPEDMLERAEQLMQEGAVDDGDAELIVEDEDPPAPEETSPPQETPPAAEEPAPDPDPPRSPDTTPSSEPADDGDAELLEDDEPPQAMDDVDQPRPQPEGEAPEPETATTARGDSVDEEGPEAGSPAAVAGSAETESFVSGATIAPRLDETEARRKAEEALFEADGFRLELLPFHVFEYEARLEGDGHHREEEGRVWVSTQSGAVVRAPKGELVDEPDIAHERFQGSLSTAETEEKAREHLLDTLERRDEIRQDYSESAVIERVMLEPDPEELELTRLGKAFAPRWRIEGQNGTVFVDAVTGELVHE